ncbi:MAG: helix-turn-helix domain-containing protein [Betaproteobacteria bacterium]|nr:helix-turn-helix domain-containing protein [Betaproteobacteria bacterium]
MTTTAPTGAPVDPLDPPHVVAAALGLTAQTLANWRCTRRNPLPFVKIGRSVRYRRSVWQEFVAAAERRAA